MEVTDIMYELTRWDDYDYSKLNNIKTVKRTSKKNTVLINDVIIMLDTETSRKKPEAGYANHVCAFTISIRAHMKNYCTLYGNKPSECCDCLDRMIKAMPGQKTIIYIHNMAYDWVFLRLFLMQKFGTPDKQLNVKSHYPIVIEFHNGLIFKDSYILSQKSLERWAKDLDVKHKKASGKWIYDQIRDQGCDFTADELEYIEHDTLAGVECIDTLKHQLNRRIFSIPYTATGIVRDEARKIGKQNHAHELFKKISGSFEVYDMLTKCFHGGYTHANRYHINDKITDQVICRDFTSSYPYVMLTEKYPMTRFYMYKPKVSIDELIRNSEKYAFMTKLIMVNPHIKDNSVVMPVLQSSKCVKMINPVIDNGRILSANYVEIYLTDVSLKLIKDQYHWDQHICIDTYYARKQYLPRWFTDYIFKLFRDKSELKGVDPLNYALAKAKLNSCYGMCVQKAISDDINEDYLTGEYTISCNYNVEKYNEYLNNRNKFLPYQWGVWVTEYAMQNLHTIGKMCEDWIYSDTDSVYGVNWDEDQIEAYNDACRKKLTDNGYDAIIINGKSYILGVAEVDKVCTEFKTLGAKRYAYRSSDDGELHITVAGVPKQGVKSLNDDIDNFQKGLIFPGTVSGKKQHTYIYTDGEIYEDDHGNETGDSIDLSPCDYLLDDITVDDWMSIFDSEVNIQVYE